MRMHAVDSSNGPELIVYQVALQLQKRQPATGHSAAIFGALEPDRNTVYRIVQIADPIFVGRGHEALCRSGLAREAHQRARRSGIKWMLACALVGCLTASQGAAMHAAVIDQDAPRLQLVEVLRLGEDNGDAPVFGRISALAVGESGAVAVGDVQETRIYVFSKDGTVQSTMGTRGEGPGDFNEISDLYFGEGDSLYVYDNFMLERLTVYDPDRYELVYTVRIQGSDSAFASELLGVTPESLVFRYLRTRDKGTEDERRFSVVRRVNWAGVAAADSVLVTEVAEMAVFIAGRGMRSESLPFGRSSTIRMGPGHTVYWGWNGVEQISVISLDGAADRQFMHRLTVRSVTRSDRRASLEQVSDRLRERLRGIRLHDTWPAYETFVVDQDGVVWLKPIVSEGQETVTWHLVDTRGQVVGTADLPAHFDLRVVKGRRLYGISKNEAGAPIVLGYKILD